MGWPERAGVYLEFAPRYANPCAPVYITNAHIAILHLTRHDSPYRDAPAPSLNHGSASSRDQRPQQRRHPARQEPEPSHSPRKRSRRGGHKRSKGPAATPVSLTSHPTSRAAYVETREWLLATHGPVCAYCGSRFSARVMTLDHVAPRRGQTAYDRRDNLVLACSTCNAAKRDQAPLAFLLASRTRAVHLLSYGSHLSPMLVDLARSLVPADAGSSAVDDDSPYRD